MNVPGKLLSMLGRFRALPRQVAHKIADRFILTRIHAFQQIEGWLTDKEAIALYRLASRLPPNSTIVEIGSWKGKSTYCLARGLRDGCLVAIDTFDATGDPISQQIYQEKRGALPLLDQFIANMKTHGVLSKIRVLPGRSADYIGKISSIHLLFIDGDHSIAGCDSDFLGYVPFLVAGGYLVFHDYDPARADLGPSWVIKNRVERSGEYHFIGLFDSLWVAQKQY